MSGEKTFKDEVQRNLYSRNKTQQKINEQAERVRKFRREASRMASKANKRVARLEANNLTDSPAYEALVKSGETRFGIRGKTYREVQSEVSRLERFLNSETSTIRGINRTLKTMAENTGIKYSNIRELQQKSSQFFELASKVEQYLRTVDDMASAIGYQKIWEAINTYTSTAKIDLGEKTNDLNVMVRNVTDALKAYETATPLPSGGWYKLSDDPDNK